MRKRTCPDSDMPSLFDFDFSSETPAAPKPITVAVTASPATAVKAKAAAPEAKKVKAAPARPKLPECLKPLKGNVPLQQFMTAARLNRIAFSAGRWCKSTNIVSIAVPHPEWDSLQIFADWETKRLLHMTEDGILWACDAEIHEDHARLTGWKVNERLYDERKVLYILQDTAPEAILQRTNPYLVEFQEKSNIPFDLLVQAPQIETLSKAGYVFTDRLKYGIRAQEAECFSRLCRPGRNPKENFKTSKAVYTTLKQCDELSVWDVYRKMDKFGRLTPDTIQQAYDNHYTAKDLENISEVLGKKHDGKSVFTWVSLIAYLNRIDQYEAISAPEGLQLLNDYLTSCSVLKMKPKTDGDSLKREHDVAARLVREHKNEEKKKRLADASHLTEKYNYDEDIFTVRGIRDYDDLIDEAKQQHNCVASYADKIANRQSLIFVMREKSTPGRSLVTIELSPKLEMRQKLLAYNKPIHNKAQSEFIDRWLKHCKGLAA